MCYTLRAHEGAVSSVKFSPQDGEYFASGGSDDMVMVWKTNFINPNWSNFEEARPENFEKDGENHSAEFGGLKHGGGKKSSTPSGQPMRRQSSSSMSSPPAPSSCHSSNKLASFETSYGNQPSKNLQEQNAERNPEGYFEVPVYQGPPLEMDSMPKQLANTLENVIRQLDILTQTVSMVEQRLTLNEDKVIKMGLFLQRIQTSAFQSPQSLGSPTVPTISSAQIYPENKKEERRNSADNPPRENKIEENAVPKEQAIPGKQQFEREITYEPEPVEEEFVEVEQTKASEGRGEEEEAEGVEYDDNYYYDDEGEKEK